MCGVIGLVYERSRPDLGLVAARLLRVLEYRGYDSTGAAVQDGGDEITLCKGVGAPSAVMERLGITRLSGGILCGQVRWATFGAVDDRNSQPHVVRCHLPFYGAHNGNVTNCDELKRWLTAEGHRVESDNDGEMVVHAVEHFYAARLRAAADRAADPEVRRGELLRAIGEACDRLQGSFAAVVIDPTMRRVYAVKKGSSLYVGVGKDEPGGRFAIASSDLSSVLKMTRVLVPVNEGEAVELSPDGFEVSALVRGQRPRAVPRQASRSRLRTEDTELRPPFSTFMEQEIHAQERACREVLRVFGGGSVEGRLAAPFIDDLAPDERAEVDSHIEALLDRQTDEAIRRAFETLMDSAAFRTALGRLPAEFRRACAEPDEALVASMGSSQAGLCADLLASTRNPDERIGVRLLDAYLERVEVHESMAAVNRFCEWCIESRDRGGRIFLVSCGTSFHAAKAAALFFNDLARTEVVPLLPGEFRGQYADTVRDGDFFVTVSQSGETKDVVDVVNAVIATGREVRRAVVVNNVNSTLAQEKADLVIPLRCGPEIAVPATKSFINQLTVFYCLALRLAERRLTTGHVKEGQARHAELSRRNVSLPELPDLIRQTLTGASDAIEEAASLLYLEPSIHILATRLLAVAREGALKIREVVLNHTEGFEASEFKHGPNTILGFNTIFGPRELEAMLERLAESVAAAPGATPDALRAHVRGALPDLFSALRRDYPLIYVTGPDPRDVALTVSQVNTHKIRGAMTIVVAEEDEALRGAAEKPPAGNPRYRSVYVSLPRTGDTLMTVFTATVALQRLALSMSLKKKAYLDTLGVPDHGVHPDVPKNVSKSITVD